MAGHRAGRHLGWTFVNRRHVGDLAASIRSSHPRSARLARLTQCGHQLAAQGSAWQHIEPRIDRLGREMLAHVVRIRVSESLGNLLRRAALPQPGIREFARSSRLTGPSSRQCRRRAGPIGSASRGVASRLAADGAGGIAPTRWPSSAANGRVPGPGSRSHGLPHSSVCNMSLAWQHFSPSGPVVLHLELELKPSSFSGNDVFIGQIMSRCTFVE